MHHVPQSARRSNPWPEGLEEEGRGKYHEHKSGGDIAQLYRRVHEVHDEGA